MDPLSITASTLTVIQSLLATFDAIKHIKGLPAAFKEVGKSLPLVENTLQLAHEALKAEKPDAAAEKELIPALGDCQKRASTLRDIFKDIEGGKNQEKEAKEWSALVKFYHNKVVPLGKAHKVESLMQDILKKLKVLAIRQIFKASTELQKQVGGLEDAIRSLSEVDPSLPDSDFDAASNNISMNNYGKAKGLVSTGSNADIAMGDKYHSGHNMYFVSRPLDVAKMQTETFQIALKTPGAGHAITQLPAFEKWCAGEIRKFWCYGIPGSGKTVLASIIIDHISNRVIGHRTKEVCVYFYFDYTKHSEHEITDILSTVLLQLLQNQEVLSPETQRVVNTWKRTRQIPTEEDYFKMIASQAELFSTIYFVVDALDECLDSPVENTLAIFLRRCQDLPKNFRMVFTSRPGSHFHRMISPDHKCEVKADEADVKAYFEKFIENHYDFQKVVENGRIADPCFKDKIITAIMKKSQGMFLLAHLHIESLASTLSLVELINKLSHLSASPQEVYHQAMDRIKTNSVSKRILAIHALSWVVYAKRALTVDELLHAVAIRSAPPSSFTDNEPRKNLLPTSSNMCTEEVLLSACIGLIVVVPGGSASERTVRLAHATAAEFLLAQEIIRDEQATFLETCLNCLFHASSQKSCYSGEELNKHCKMYPLFRYAAAYWGHHFSEVPKVKGSNYKLAWDFASDEVKLGNALRTMTDPRVSHQTKVSGGHVSAYFGLEGLVRRAMSKASNVDFNARTKSGDTPLHWAVAHNQQDFALFLINAGADLNIQNTNGKTVLHMATAMDHRHFINILIEKRADLELQDSEGYTCLRWAARYGYQRTVSILLEAGAKISASDKDGYTALRWAAREGYKSIVKTLIDRGSSIESPGSEEWTLMRWAAQEGQDYIISRLAKRGVSLNNSDSEGLTALSWAVKYKREMTVWQLIKGGADVNKPDKKGNRPLHLAAHNTSGDQDRSSLNIVWILLQNKAEIDARNKHGMTPLHLAAARGTASTVWLLLENGANPTQVDTNDHNALYKAVTGLHLGCCQILIQKAEHLVNSKDLSWRTPLHDAASEGSLAIVEMLLRHDAHIDAQTRQGQTPLYLSILQDHLSVAELLVKKGANLQILNTNKRWTALHHAAWTGSILMVEMLIRNGADVDAQDRQGYTAQHLALQAGHGVIVDCLRATGADTQYLDPEGLKSKDLNGEGKEKSFTSTDTSFPFEEAKSAESPQTEERPWWKGDRRFAATVEDE
ncbi:hypothetical protein CMEL01_12914 [Colletotrichum melonis]|uniref:NACHT-NTPase and P-loop NTPases N-terminal domain-containing protein n=1 Tax=Colletotrichum melonis TaxID=1209925 RepID=A0AAI9USY5_9PEZI|nr:hypothetical protein CMEL01_12914 [Colletotrichum melonis]